jgi:hypothetical protein
MNNAIAARIRREPKIAGGYWYAVQIIWPTDIARYYDQTLSDALRTARKFGLTDEQIDY